MFAFTNTIFVYIIFGLLILVFGAIGVISNQYVSQPLFYTMTNISSCVNLITLLLQFTFSTQIYDKFCSKCDRQMTICCNNCGKRKNDKDSHNNDDDQKNTRQTNTKKHILMMKMEIASSSTGSQQARASSKRDDHEDDEYTMQQQRMHRIRTLS